MEDEVQKAEQGVKKAWPVLTKWVGGVTALIGLSASFGGGISWLVNHHRQKAERHTEMALAQEQARQGEYQAAVHTYAGILGADSMYRPALDGQLSAAMLWVENFDVVSRQNQNPADLSAPALDQIMTILDAGLARAKGSQGADIQAHLGWAHWLNQKIAERGFGPVAQQDFRAALATDPSNVYANAMMGNWMLQNGRSFPEAVHYLDVAVSTGKARPLVRQLQIYGLVDLDQTGARAELMRVANGMRKSGEPLNQEDKKHILTFCLDPVLTDHRELTESLSALPPDDAWQTYTWLDAAPDDEQARQIRQQFIRANMLEIAGKRQESLERFRELQQDLKNQPGAMKNSVDAAVARLSRG